MVKDYDLYAAQQNQTDSTADQKDYIQELNGAEAGRIPRFLPESLSKNHMDREKRKEAFHSQLKLLLADPYYVQLYSEVTAQLKSAEDEAERALTVINERLLFIKHKMKTAQPEQKAGLDVQQAELLLHRNEIETYQIELLQPISATINDEDNPPSVEELAHFNLVVTTEKPPFFDLYLKESPDNNAESAAKTYMQDTPLNAPSVCAHFDAARHDCTSGKNANTPASPPAKLDLLDL
ncbi:MAG: hypothetical protein HRT35_30450 [Algicola sp.]|nr:hypothetical protein [Algicola sp.]